MQITARNPNSSVFPSRFFPPWPLKKLCVAAFLLFFCQCFLPLPLFFFFLMNLFIYFWLCWVFVAARAFLQLQRAGATLCCGARASHCGGFSCCRAWALGAQASVVVARRLSSCGSRALERRVSSCGAQAQLLRGMWDLPGPGLEPVSPALAGRFLTTAPPGKSLSLPLFSTNKAHLLSLVVQVLP